MDTNTLVGFGLLTLITAVGLYLAVFGKVKEDHPRK